MKYLIGVDFGGSSSKATLLGEDGRVYATAVREYPTYYPRNGWAEQDAQDSYDAAVSNIRDLLQQTGAAPGDIAALALDGSHAYCGAAGSGRPARAPRHLLDGYPFYGAGGRAEGNLWRGNHPGKL